MQNLIQYIFEKKCEIIFHKILDNFYLAVLGKIFVLITKAYSRYN